MNWRRRGSASIILRTSPSVTFLPSTVATTVSAVRSWVVGSWAKSAAVAAKNKQIRINLNLPCVVAHASACRVGIHADIRGQRHECRCCTLKRLLKKYEDNRSLTVAAQ